MYPSRLPLENDLMIVRPNLQCDKITLFARVMVFLPQAYRQWNDPRLISLSKVESYSLLSRLTQSLCPHS